jgi:hypothetical protein
MKAQVDLLESARQGDLKSLQLLINQPLEPKCIEVTLCLQKGCLTVTAEAPINPPSKHSLINFLKLGMTNIMPLGVNSVLVHGKVQGLGDIAWQQRFALQAEPQETERPETKQPELRQPKLRKPVSQRPSATRTEATEAQEAELRSFITPEHMKHFSQQSLVRQPQALAPQARRSSPPPPQIGYFLWATSLMLGALLSAHIVTWFMPRSLARTAWEYHIVTLGDEDFNAAIDKLGQEGWELSYARRAIASESDSEYTLYELILKRPKS